MTAFYKILFSNDVVHGVAYGTKKGEVFSLPRGKPVKDWRSRILELREGEFVDYLASDFGCRICSEKLKAILDQYATPNDELQWLPVEVYSENEKHPYWILHFPNPPDILNSSQSIYVDSNKSMVIKPVVALDALGKHHVFSYKNCGSLSLFISNQVKRAISAAKCTGMEISPTPCR